MQQLGGNPFFYIVTTGEVVTIVATPIKLAPEMVRASTDGGQTLPNIDGATPTFQFAINKPENSVQITDVLCNFATLPGDDTEGRMCNLTAQGSKGGNFTLPPIKESDSVHAISINFLVDNPENNLANFTAAAVSLKPVAIICPHCGRESERVGAVAVSPKPPASIGAKPRKKK